MAQYVFTMHRLGKVVPPKREILKNISLSFFPGAKIGVLGLNGSGKSTLLKIMAGVDTEFEGEARPMPELNIGYLPQEPILDPTKTVREVVEEAVSVIKDAQARLDEVYAAYADPKMPTSTSWLPNRPSSKRSCRPAMVTTWSVNWKSRPTPCVCRPGTPRSNTCPVVKNVVWPCAVCCCPHPDMLLLDEPTNHLDADSVAWLEHFLHDFPGTVVAITHDRYFLDNVAGWILELDRGAGIPYEGNYSGWLEAKSDRLAAESKQQSAHEKAMKEELEWVRKGAKARQSKSKARLQRFEEMQSQEFQKRSAKPTRSTSRPVRVWATRSSNSRTSPRATAIAC